MKGVILAGGSGTRLSPVSRAVSKQLLPVYDKPLIYYPLTTLVLAGIREILLVCNEFSLPLFRRCLGDGQEFGITIDYTVQNEPLGLAHGLLHAEEFTAGEPFAFILGDNFFYGRGLGGSLRENLNLEGAKIFCFQSPNPSEYGVVEIVGGKIASIEEKPKHPKSNYVVTGLYFFDNSAFERSRKLTPSHRGELEMVDLLLSYQASESLQFSILPPGTAWLDTGTFERLHDASSLVRVLQASSGQRIGDPRIAAQVQGWI